MFILTGGEQIYDDDKPEAVRGFMLSSGDISGACKGSGRSGFQGPLQKMFRRVAGVETYCNAWGLVEMKTRLSAYPNGQRDGAYFFSEGLGEWLRAFDTCKASVSPQWIWCWEERRLLALAQEEVSIVGGDKKLRLFRLPKAVPIEITLADIADGEPGHAGRCAAARAISRSLGHGVLVDGTGVLCAEDHETYSCFGRYPVGARLRVWLGRYDNELPVSPVSVSVEPWYRRMEVVS